MMALRTGRRGSDGHRCILNYLDDYCILKGLAGGHEETTRAISNHLQPIAAIIILRTYASWRANLEDMSHLPKQNKKVIN